MNGKRMCALGIMLAVAGGVWAARAGTPLSADLVNAGSLLVEMTDRDNLARWPRLPFRSAQAASYDRRSTAVAAPGWFANEDWSNFIREENHHGRREWVMMETDGPGAITRFWMGMSTPSLPPGGTLRFYLDGAQTPTFEERAGLLLSGRSFAPPPLAEVTARGHNLYFPIPFARGCKVTYDRQWRESKSDADRAWYVIEYRRYEPGTMVASFSRDQLPALKAIIDRTVAALSGADDPPVPSPPIEFLFEGSGKRFDFAGPGAVRALALKVDPKNPKQWAPLRLVLQFDGPATVDLPVAALFGISHGFRAYRDWFREVREDGTLILRLTMPFERSAHLCLLQHSREHSAAGFAAVVGPWDWDADSMRLHALWRRQGLTTPKEGGLDWTVAEVAGRGVYVGDALAVENCGRGWWGEGDEKIWVDGDHFPRHFGTGSEDYYGYSFGDLGKFFMSPFHAMPLDRGNARAGWVSLTRNRLLDRIPFESSLRHDLEVIRGRECAETYEAVSMWYQAGE